MVWRVCFCIHVCADIFVSHECALQSCLHVHVKTLILWILWWVWYHQCTSHPKVLSLSLVYYALVVCYFSVQWSFYSFHSSSSLSLTTSIWFFFKLLQKVIIPCLKHNTQLVERSNFGLCQFLFWKQASRVFKKKFFLSYLSVLLLSC